jgi:endonuclease/exonuclease/phosphatase family metal-dependent hydrolase
MLRSIFLFAYLLLITPCPSASNAEEVNTTRVMSFNVRYGSAADGENHWDIRKSFLAETIKTFDPDLLGTQETLAFQRDFLAEQLPAYGHVGVGRTDGKLEGEMMALFFKKDRFSKVEEGHFWLSESPQTPGSVSWDSSLPRMATWVRLKDLKTENRTLFFVNTHFDHIGVTARNESSKLIRDRVKTMQGDSLVVLTGDFNSGEDSDAYRYLFADADGNASPLVDSFRAAHPERSKEEGTFSGFRSTNVNGARIDWIGVSRDFVIESVEIDRTSQNGKTPSDHYPVTAVLK